jgi:acyl-CoA synthetase (AMP-forming)/AMP-acid ligase II
MKDPVAPSSATTISEVLRWQAARRPEQRAFVCLERGEREAGSLTFAQLNERARAIAQALIDRGLTGQTVILAYPSCLEFVAALFGCLFAGAIAIPSPVATRGYGAERLRAIASDAGASMILTLRSVRDQSYLAANENPMGTAALGQCLATDEIPDDAPRASERDPGSTDLALLQYTSGSTGSPRGVALTHANVMSNQRALATALPLSAGENAVYWLPLYHDMGLIGGVLHSIYVGTTSFLLPPMAFLQKPMRWLHAIHRYRATCSMAPCFAYRLCVERGRLDAAADLDLSSWRVAICGGETIRPQWLEQFAATFSAVGFHASSLLPAYGLAEATLLATATPAGAGLTTARGATQVTNDVSGEPARALALCGTVIPDHRLIIVDPVTNRRVPPGTEGEIWMQGASVAAGYWRRPEETHATFEASLADEPELGRWLRTGDLGFLGPDGLVVTGRLKEIIVIRGVNYDPLDIEMVAQEGDASLASGGASAFAVEVGGDDHVVLVSELNRSALRDLDANIVAAAVVEAISRRLGLTLYDLVLLRPGALPRTTSGKIRRRICREQYLAGELAAVESIDVPILGRSRLRGRSVA